MTPTDELTEREWAVARLAAEGHQNKIIAFKLGLSEATVKCYLLRARRKFHVTNRTQLAHKVHIHDTERTVQVSQAVATAIEGGATDAAKELAGRLGYLMDRSGLLPVERLNAALGALIMELSLMPHPEIVAPAATLLIEAANWDEIKAAYAAGVALSTAHEAGHA